MKSVKAFAFIFGMILLAGCATITKGRYQEIKIDSNVLGALVELDGVEIGYTPYTGKVRKGREGNIKVSKQGYIAGDIIQMKKKRMALTFTGGNTLLGFIAGSPFYFTFAPAEQRDYQDRLNIYEERKVQYDREKEEGTLGSSETEPEKPYNYAGLSLASGIVASLGVIGTGSLVDALTSTAWEYSPSQYYVQLKEENSSEQSNLDFTNELAIRYFATMNHSQIAIDAGENAENNGEYVNALSNFMEIKMDGDIAKRSINEALEKSKGDQVLFGDELVKQFWRQK